MKNLKKLTKSLRAVLSSFLIMNLISCGVGIGLGESVDTEDPKVSITYPPASSIAREKFTIAGTCSDDKGVVKVKVNIYNTDSHKDYGTYTADLFEGKTWSCTFNQSDAEGKYPFPDGNYSIKVVSEDDAGRTSGASSQSIYIDNTAPVFVLTAPGSVSIDSCTTFGSLLKISGQIAEDHSVDSMTLSVYDKDKKFLTSWTEKEINISGTTNVTFAKYISNPALEKDGLHKNYITIYDVEKGGDQPFYCTLRLSDSAGIWQTPVFEENQNPLSDDRKDGYEGDSGNTTTSVWLNDDIYGQDAAVGDLLSKNANPQFEIGDLRNLINGSYSKSSVTEEQKAAALKILQDAKVDTVEREKYLAFKMNKDANPGYSFMGYSFSGLNFGENVASKLGTITLKADAGLDGTTFSPSTVKVYLFGPFVDSVGGSLPLISEDELKKIFYDTTNYANNHPERTVLMYDGEKGLDGKQNSGPYLGTSTTSWTHSLVLPDNISSGSIYIVALTGTDKDEMEFLPQGYFGFKGKSSGQAPDVTINSPLTDSLSNNLGNLLVSGNVKSFDASKIVAIEYETTVIDILNGNKTIGTINGNTETALKPADGSIGITAGTLGADSSIDFEIDLSKGVWNPLAGVTVDPRKFQSDSIYKYIIVLNGHDATGLTGKNNVSTQIDTKQPEITISNVAPVANSVTVTGPGDEEITTYYVNGTIKVTGNIVEHNLKDVQMIITDGNAEKTFNLETQTYFNETLNTTGFDDGVPLQIKIRAEDKAGNIKEIVNTEYIVDQNTDYPVISSESSTAVSLAEVGVNKNLFGITSNNKFTATITDDDGLDKVIFTLYKEDGTTVEETKEYSCKGKATYNLSYILPKKEGKHIVKIYAEDIYAKSVENRALSTNVKTEIFNIGIDAGVPTLQFTTTNRSKTAASTAKKITGLASDSSGIVSIKRYSLTKSPEAADITKDDNAVINAEESKWVSGGAGNTITYNPSSGEWSDTISAAGIGNAPGRRRYVATDIYGNESILDFIYYVDSEPPVIQSIDYPADLSQTSVFNGNNIFSVKGKASDNNKELSKVLFYVGSTAPAEKASPIDGAKRIYDTNSGTWNTSVLATSKNADAAESTTFTANIDISSMADNTYKIYLAVFDEADNQSYVDSTKIITIKSDKTAPVLAGGDVESYYKTVPVTVSGTYTEENLEKISVKVNGSSSENAAAVDSVNKKWSYKVTEPGSYSLMIICTDKAGLTDSLTTEQFVIDTQAPKIIAAPVNSNWLKSGSQNVTAYITDVLDSSSARVFSSGINKASFVVNGTSSSNELSRGSACDSTGTKVSGGSYNIYSTTYDFADGTNSVVIDAQDSAGNSVAASAVNYLIDTNKPVINSITGAPTGYNNTTYGAMTSFDITVNASDQNVTAVKGKDDVSKIKRIYITKAGSTTEIASKNIGTSTYSGTVSVLKSDGILSDGVNVFNVYAEDNAGNISDYKQFTVTLDDTNPVPKINSISPVAEVSGGKNLVNGTITVSGTITENNSFTAKLIVEDGVAAHKKEYGPITTTAFAQNVDTTQFSDGSNLKISVEVTDAAGNVGSVTSTDYKISQATDTPVITLNNADSAIKTVDQIKNANKTGASLTNLFAKGALLTASIRDDDGIKVVSVKYKKLGSSSPYTVDQILSNGTSTNYSLNYHLPEEEAAYEIQIDVTDTVGNLSNSSNSVNFTLAVDSGSPKLKVLTGTTTWPANTNETVSGTVSDGTEVASLVRIDQSTQAKTNLVVNASWSDTFSSGVAGKTYRYQAEDVYGNLSFEDFTFDVDAEAPVITGITTPLSLVINGNNVYTVIGTGTDNKGISTVKYVVTSGAAPSTTVSPLNGAKQIYITDSNWLSATPTVSSGIATFKLNVDFSDAKYTDGAYKVYIAAFDDAGNQSIVDASKVVTLTSDKTPPVLTINTVPQYSKENIVISGTLVENNLESLKVRDKSGTEKSITVNSGAWTYPVTTDGSYQFTFTATDKAGFTHTPETVYVILDKNLPVIKTKPAGEGWSNSRTQTVEVYAGDKGADGTNYSSGMNQVTYKIGSGTANEIAQGLACDGTGSTSASGKYYNIYKTAFDFDSDGTKTVYVNASDVAGNNAAQASVIYKIDTKAPVLGTVTPAKTGFNTTTIADFNVTVASVDDRNGASSDVSGVVEIYIMKGSEKVVTKTGLSGSQIASTVLKIAKENLTDGSNIFTVYAKDAAGNTSAGSSFTIDYDSVAPVVNVNSISPVAAVSGDVNFVNGVITIKGTVNDTNTSEIKLTVSGGAKVKEYVQALATSFSQEVDTTYFATGSSQVPLTISVYAKDTAGNETTYSVTDKYTADQTTDVPVIDSGDTSDSIALSQIALNKNLFGITSNNKFTATITDDDGVASVKITVKNSAGTVIDNVAEYGISVASNPYIEDAGNKGSYKFNYKLPSKEGKYIVEIVATDKFGLEKLWTYNIGVDAGNPNLQFTVTNNARVGANVAKVVTGSATDSSGVKEIYRYATTSNSDQAVITGTPQAKWISGGAENTITYNSSTGEWSDTIAATGTTGIGTTPGRRRYIVRDVYGNETQLDFVYGVDAEAPVIRGITSPSVVNAQNVYNGNNVYSVIGKVSDNYKEFERVQFYVGTTAPADKASPIDPAKRIYDTSTGVWENAVLSTTKNDDSWESTTFTCNVNLKEKADGQYKVYIAAFDQAYIQSYVDSSLVVTLTSDKTKPVLSVTNLAETYNKSSGLSKSVVPVKGTITETNLESLAITYKVRGNSGSTTIGPVAIVPDGSSWSYNLQGPGNFEEIKIVANDKAGFSSEWTGNTLVDDVNPLMILDPVTPSYTDGQWHNSTSQRIQVLVGDKGSDNGTYSSGISNVKYYLDGDETGVEMAPGSARNSEGTTSGVLAYNIYNSTFDVSNGTHSLIVKAVDLAGNEISAGPFTYKVDDKSPNQPVFDKNSTEINKADYESASVVIKVSSSDSDSSARGGASDTSKISKVILKKGNTEISSTELATPVQTLTNYSLSVPKTYGAKNTSSIVTGTNTFTVFVQDVAGNISDGLDYIVTADITEPTVTYSSHANGAVVNKTITLKGTYNDNNEVVAASGKIYVLKADGTKVLIDSFSHSGDGTWTYSNLNTVTYDSTTYGTQNASGARPVKFLVTFQDSVGNVSLDSSFITLNIDQNSDRPLIKLTNLKSDGSSVIKSTSTYGSIEDDDGTDIQGLWVIEKSVYDGMASKKVPSTSADNGWTKASIESGNWTVDTTEGPHSWYFYIIDKPGAAFSTVSSSAVSRPYIQGAGDDSKVDNSAAIGFTADETGPVVTMYVAHGSAVASDGKWKTAGEVFGGTNRYLWLKLEVEEEVGMQKSAGNYVIPEIKIAGNSQTVAFVSTPSETAGVYTYLLKGIDLSGLSLSDGTVQISSKVYDASSQPGNGGVNIIYDNSAPVVQVISPTTAISDAVTSAVVVKGIVSDSYSAVSRLEWAIPVKENLDSYTTTTGDWTTVPSSASWEINFSSGASDSSDSLLYYAVTKNAAGTDYMYNIESAGTENIFKIPLWFRVTDSVGNVAVRKTFVDSSSVENQLYVLADSDGGKPKAWISSPEENSTTSGSVTVYGGASDDISVSRVELAYASTESGTYTVVTASGTNSWKYSVDTTSMENLYVKVRAYDEENQTRDWTTPVHVRIDSQTPTIKNLKVVQYGAGKSSGTPVTSRDYTAGMYLSNNSVAELGSWYLTGTIADNVTVASVTTSKMSSSTTTIIDLPATILSGGATKTYSLNVPLVTSASGQIYSVLKATDNAGTYAEQTIKINIDSTNPSLYNTSNAQSTSITDNLRIKSLSKALGSGASSSTVANSNGYFTLGDTVIEGESGLAYLAFYFERDGSSEKCIYNPMLESAGNANKTVLSSIIPVSTSSMVNGKMYINKDNLPVLYVTGLTRSSEDSLTLASLGTNKNIRKGGILRIGGSYSRITNVTAAGVVSFEPSVPVNFTSAEMVYAQVVDHQLTESVDSDGSVMNDDGDEMVESVNQIGTSYIWSASINSTTIPDGPVYIRVAAIDNAGNVTTGKILTSVTNNRPRIAKVMLATDLNQSSTFEYRGKNAPVNNINDGTSNGQSFGEFSYYSALNKVSGEAQYNVTIDSSKFKVKNGLCILPEFTGGNGESIKYASQIDDSSSPQFISSASLTAMSTKAALTTTGVSGFKVVNKGAVDIGDQISKWGGIIFDNSTLNVNGTKMISLTFWDETPETVQGTTSQWALLGIPVTVQTTDTGIPSAQIKPLYWNGKEENSVYRTGSVSDGDLKYYGHVELKDDLPSSFTASGSGYKVRRDKVSGKIIIEGTVSDETLLNKVQIKIGAQETWSSLYAGGVWSSSGNANSVVNSLTVEDVDLSQDGHEAKFSAVLNTEKITAIAALGQSITVIASDCASTPHSASAVYTVDVVPYITEVWTGMSDNGYSTGCSTLYSRSSTGEYPVRVGESITIYGWNLNSSPVVNLGGETISSTVVENLDGKADGTYGIRITVPSQASDSLEVSVNGIPALNNENENNALGSATGNPVTYAGYYNRRPNGVNNNILTDDVKLDIWDFKSAAEPIGSAASNVHMKVGPYLSSDASNSGRIGFSFKNAIGYFNMPGYKYGSGPQTIYTKLQNKVDIYVKASQGYNAIHYWGNSLSKTTSTPVSMGSTVSYNGSTYYHVVFDSTLTSSGDGSIEDFKFLLTKAVGGWTSQTSNVQITKVGLYVFDGEPYGTPSPTSTTGYLTSQTVDYSSQSFSQTRFGTNFGGFNNNNFTFDSLGRTYGVAQCPDTSGTVGKSGNLQFFSRKVGSDTTTSSQDLNYNYKNVTNARRIESTSYYVDSTVYTDELRAQSPAMASYVDGDTTYVYLAYYDHGLGMIKFRVGTVGANQNLIGLGLQDLAGATTYLGGEGDTNKIGQASGSLFDSLSTKYSGYKYVYNLSGSANSPSSNVAIGSLNNGTPVVVWYDAANEQLIMKYTTLAKLTATGATWTSKIVSTKGGKNVAMVVDADNGLHFAYSSNSGADLMYSYYKYSAGSFTAAAKDILVDAYDNVGTHCSIDVGRESTTKPWIPYISYRRDASAVSTKIAYPVYASSATASTVPVNGANSDGTFTGAWSVSTLPSAHNSISDNIGVGIVKDWTAGSGVIHNFPTGIDTSATDTGTYTICNATILYGNGTKNPALGYAVEDGFIELAQKK